VQTKAGREKTTILEGLQGFFEPGKITAVVSLMARSYLCISPNPAAAAAAADHSNQIQTIDLSRVQSWPRRQCRCVVQWM
jgi:hypothetical protein